MRPLSASNGSGARNGPNVINSLSPSKTRAEVFCAPQPAVVGTSRLTAA